MPTAIAATDNSGLIDFGESKEFSKIFHDDFEANSNSKKHIVILTRSTSKESLLGMKILRNPYITKEIFTSAYHEKFLKDHFSDDDREFLERNNVKITSSSDGGLVNFIEGFDTVCDRLKVPRKNFYIEGGPTFFNNLLDKKLWPHPRDVPIEFLLLSRRIGKNPLDDRYLCGRPFYRSEIERVFDKIDDSRLIEKEGTTFKFATYLNKEYHLRRPERVVENIKERDKEIQKQVNSILRK